LCSWRSSKLSHFPAIHRSLRQDPPTPAKRGGKREANHPLWRIVITRMSAHHDAETRLLAEADERDRSGRKGHQRAGL